MIFKLAWRNIWRNKRRTFITIASIFFAVFFAIFMNAIQKGAWTKMLDDVVHYYTGYLQIQHTDYIETKDINKLIDIDIINDLKDVPNVKTIIPRLESFMLVSYKNKTSGMMIVGIDPVLENEMTKINERIVDGKPFESVASTGVIIGEGASDKMKLVVGDTMIMIGQGYHGVNAVGKYPIVGIAQFASPELNNRMVYMSLNQAQQLIGAEQLLSSIAIDVYDKNILGETKAHIIKAINNDKFIVQQWEEMMPELLEAQQTDAAGNYIFLLVLYMIISFGILGTVVMMVKERSYEFGILNAIGMKRYILSAVVYFEIVFLGLLGVIAGFLAALPLVYYFNIHPIDLTKSMEDASEAYAKWGFSPIFPTAMDVSLFVGQGLIVLAILSVLAIYPIFKIYQLKPVEAMKSN